MDNCTLCITLPFGMENNLQKCVSVGTQYIEVFLQVDEDEPLFLSLISDLFPGIQLDNATYEDLQVAIQHQVDEAKMVNHPSWNLKIVQVSVSVTLLPIVSFLEIISHLETPNVVILYGNKYQIFKYKTSSQHKLFWNTHTCQFTGIWLVDCSFLKRSVYVTGSWL